MCLPRSNRGRSQQWNRGFHAAPQVKPVYGKKLFRFFSFAGRYSSMT